MLKTLKNFCMLILYILSIIFILYFLSNIYDYININNILIPEMFGDLAVSLSATASLGYLNNGHPQWNGKPEKSYGNFLDERKKIREELSDIGGVYSLVNLLNGDKYVGSANNFYGRFIKYYSESARKAEAKKGSYINRALNFYGLNNFGLNILNISQGIDPRAKEQWFLDNFEWPYNTALNALAPMSGKSHSPSSFAHVSHPVICVNTITGEVNEFPSIRRCALALGVDHSVIISAINNQRLVKGVYCISKKIK